MTGSTIAGCGAKVNNTVVLGHRDRGACLSRSGLPGLGDGREPDPVRRPCRIGDVSQVISLRVIGPARRT
jgi:hypothetical protein